MAFKIRQTLRDANKKLHTGVIMFGCVNLNKVGVPVLIQNITQSFLVASLNILEMLLVFYNIMYMHMQVPKTEPESRQPYAGDFLIEFCILI